MRSTRYRPSARVFSGDGSPRVGRRTPPGGRLPANIPSGRGKGRKSPLPWRAGLGHPTRRVVPRPLDPTHCRAGPGAAFPGRASVMQLFLGPRPTAAMRIVAATAIDRVSPARRWRAPLAGATLRLPLVALAPAGNRRRRLHHRSDPGVRDLQGDVHQGPRRRRRGAARLRRGRRALRGPESRGGCSEARAQEARRAIRPGRRRQERRRRGSRRRPDEGLGCGGTL